LSGVFGVREQQQLGHDADDAEQQNEKKESSRGVAH
jgi:hypothetical protein